MLTFQPSNGLSDGAGNAVVFVYEHNFTLNRLIRQAERGQNDLVAGLAAVCSRTVEADGAAPRLGRYGVGFEALAVGHVPDVHHLPIDDARRFHEVGIDSHTAHIVDITAGDGRSMYLALADAYQFHGNSISGKRGGVQIEQWSRTAACRLWV